MLGRASKNSRHKGHAGVLEVASSLRFLPDMMAGYLLCCGDFSFCKSAVAVLRQCTVTFKL